MQLISSLLVIWTCFLGATWTARTAIPIKADEDFNNVERERVAGCIFDNHFYELEDKWHPNLGPPFGIMYCVECQCQPSPRKGQITGRVKCFNFKTQCPKPDCPDPVLLPDQCCKVCPQAANVTRNKPENEERNETQKATEFLAVISDPASRHIVRGTFQLDGSSLHYTIHFNSGFQPTSVRFQDEEGNALFTQQVEENSIRSHKVCGVWDRVPRPYRRSLGKETLRVVLTTKTNSELKGTILAKRLHAEESFSALLHSRDSRATGFGGVLSWAFTSEGQGIEFSALLTGVPSLRRDAKQIGILVVEKADDGYALRNVSAVISPKTHEMSGKLNELTLPESRLLMRGLLRITVRLANSLEFVVSGPVTPKMTCNVFQAVIYDHAKPRPREGVGSGAALFELKSDGTFSYRMHLPFFYGKLNHIQFENDPKKSRRRLYDLAPSYTSGWANGTTTTPHPRDIQNLFSEDLILSLSSDNTGIRMLAHVRQLPYHPVQQMTFPSVIPENPTAPFLRDMSGSAVAWLYIDDQCVMTYSLMIDGYTEVYTKKLQPMLTYAYDQQGTPVRKQAQLELFKKNRSTGKVKNLKNDVLMGMPNGTIEILITATGENEPRLRGKVSVVDDCSARHKFNGFVMEDPASVAGQAEPNYSCYYRDKTFEDGASWKAEHKGCTMCSCQRGKITCEDVVCPKPSCRNPYKVEGECCLTCHLPVPNSGMIQQRPVVAAVTVDQKLPGCYLDKKWHKPGSQWHPYIPPFGFSKCVTCTCTPGTLTVNCSRNICPTLTCPESEAIRDHPSDCCKRCPVTVPVNTDVVVSNYQNDTLGDEGIVHMPEDLLKEGGCRFQNEIHKNGFQWSPRVQPFGVVNCVVCRCKDGKTSCRRQKCPKLTCPFIRKENDECCPVCTDETDPKAKPNKRLTRRQKKQRRRRE